MMAMTWIMGSSSNMQLVSRSRETIIFAGDRPSHVSVVRRRPVPAPWQGLPDIGLIRMLRLSDSDPNPPTPTFSTCGCRRKNSFGLRLSSRSRSAAGSVWLIVVDP
jgi:hypothetical protein